MPTRRRAIPWSQVKVATWMNLVTTRERLTSVLWELHEQGIESHFRELRDGLHIALIAISLSDVWRLRWFLYRRGNLKTEYAPEPSSDFARFSLKCVQADPPLQVHATKSRRPFTSQERGWFVCVDTPGGDIALYLASRGVEAHCFQLAQTLATYFCGNWTLARQVRDRYHTTVRDAYGLPNEEAIERFNTPTQGNPGSASHGQGQEAHDLNGERPGEV